MALIALTSANGSPGVTTTALGLAFVWPRPVLLLEADPTGGSGILAGYFRGESEHADGLVELVLSPLGLADALPQIARMLKGTTVSFVSGTRSPAQASALRDHWSGLAIALQDLDDTGQDVIVDAGRLGLAGSPVPLLSEADLALLLTRTHLPAVSAARSWAERIREPGEGWRNPGLCLVGEGMPYVSGEVARVLGLPAVAELPEDPAAAAVYHRGARPSRGFASGTYVRALRAAVDGIQAQVTRSRSTLVRGTQP